MSQLHSLILQQPKIKPLFYRIFTESQNNHSFAGFLLNPKIIAFLQLWKPISNLTRTLQADKALPLHFGKSPGYI